MGCRLARNAVEMGLEDFLRKNKSPYDENDDSENAVIETCESIFQRTAFRAFLILRGIGEEKYWESLEMWRQC